MDCADYFACFEICVGSKKQDSKQICNRCINCFAANSVVGCLPLLHHQKHRNPGVKNERHNGFDIYFFGAGCRWSVAGNGKQPGHARVKAMAALYY